MANADRRLAEQMDAALNAYDARNLSFRAMLDRLETCVLTMSEAEENWKDAFLSEWGVLEEIYAYAASEDLKTIPQSDMPLIEATLSELRRMIAEKLES